MVSQQGVTLVPLKLYFSDRVICKLLVGVCRGKHNYDKRQTLKDKQVKIDINRALKEHNRGN